MAVEAKIEDTLDSRAPSEGPALAAAALPSAEAVKPRKTSTRSELDRDVAFATVACTKGTTGVKAALAGLPSRDAADHDTLQAVAKRIAVGLVMRDASKSDVKLALKLTSTPGSDYGHYEESVRADFEVALRALSDKPGVHPKVPDSLLTSAVTAAPLIEKSPALIERTSKEARLTEKVALAAAGSKRSIGHIPKKAFESFPEALTLAKATLEKPGKFGMSFDEYQKWFKAMAPALKNDPEVMANVVRDLPSAYFDLSKALQSNPKVRASFETALKSDESRLFQSELTEEQLQLPGVPEALARGAGLKAFPPSYRANPKWAELACKANPLQFGEFAPPELRGRRDLAIAYFKEAKRPAQPSRTQLHSLTRVAPELRDDDEVVWSAVLADPSNFKYASDRLRGSIQLTRFAVAHQGQLLAFASPAVRADKETVMMAVAENGAALPYAAPELQKDPDVIAAIEDNHETLDEARTLLQGSPQEAEVNYRAGDAAAAFNAFEQQNPYWFENKNAVLDVLERTGQAEKVLPTVQKWTDHLNDDAFVGQALKRGGGRVIGWIPEKHQKDPAVRALAASDPATVRFKDSEKALASDPQALAEAFALAPFRYGSLEAKNRKNPEIALRAISADANQLRYLPRELFDDTALLAKIASANPLVLDRLHPERLRAVFGEFPELMKMRAELDLELEALNIHFPSRFHGDYALLREIIANRKTPAHLDPRPLFVHVSSKHDWNGALEWNSMQLMSRHYRVMYYETDSAPETLEAILHATRHKKASVLEIIGHGTQKYSAMGAGDPAYEKPEDSPAVFNAERDTGMVRASNIRDRLEPNAHFVLTSCSTGNGRARELNVANMFARALPHINIYASTVPMNRGFKIASDGRFLSPGFTRGRTYHVRPRTQE